MASALTIVDMPAAGHRFRPTVAAMIPVARKQQHLRPKKWHKTAARPASSALICLSGAPRAANKEGNVSPDGRGTLLQKFFPAGAGGKENVAGIEGGGSAVSRARADQAYARPRL